jgi:dTDP-4-amino-4,6-dideoxygalactose transaminase
MFIPPQPRYRLYGGAMNYLCVLRDVLMRRVHSGEDVASVERKLTVTMGMPEAILVPQARFGLYLALRQLIKPGQEVILSPYTIYDVINMVVCAGGQPVFADTERETCNMDLREVMRLVNSRTGAVITTHLHGLASGIEELASYCAEKHIPLIEDAAQAFGGYVNSKALGSFGDVGIFSFGRVKNVNSFYGGAVVCRDRAVAAGIRAALAKLPYEATNRLVKRVAHCLIGDLLTNPVIFRVLTFWIFRYACLREVQSVNKLVQTEDDPVPRTEVPEVYKRRITPMQARLIDAQLDRVNEQTAERIARARRYDEGLADLQQIMRPPLRQDRSHIYLSYPIQVLDRWDLVKFLMRHGRDVSVQHITNTADLPCFSEFSRDCHNARMNAGQVVLLPTYPRYSMAEVDKTISLLRSYFSVLPRPTTDISQRETALGN